MARVLDGAGREHFHCHRKVSWTAAGLEDWHCQAARPKARGTHLSSHAQRPAAGCKSSFICRSLVTPEIPCPDCQPPPPHPLTPSLPPPGLSQAARHLAPTTFPAPRVLPRAGRRTRRGCQAWHQALLAQPDWVGPVLGSWCLHNPSGKGSGLAKTRKLLEAFRWDKLGNSQSLKI